MTIRMVVRSKRMWLCAFINFRRVVIHGENPCARCRSVRNQPNRRRLSEHKRNRHQIFATQRVARMTSPSFRIVGPTGEQSPNGQWKSDLDFSVSPPRLAFSIFDMTHKPSEVSYSHRFGFKDLGHPEILESRRDGHPLRGRVFLATGHVVSPMSHRGR